MSDKKENALVLYAKYPRPGEVKTRLSQGASGLTAIEASNLYLAILKDLFLTINNPDNPFKLYICALSHETAFRESFGQYLQFLPDEGDGDLGLSLYRTFQIMKQRDYKKVIIMGSDLPLITTQDLIHGFRQLETQSFVLGPDQSGGCYVIGARDAYPLFHEIPWSEGRDFHILKNRVLSQSI
ncbi:MAG: DUF2064 domain-containing protein, partial [Spirochaetota bacterium]|nr:DUF2064 domain-containing protein [Spirochaetota bacterium]